MGLATLRDFEASSRRSLKEHDFTHFEVCTAQGEKVGQVADILVDGDGKCQYVVVALNDEMGGKQVLLPYTQCQVDQGTRCINVSGLNAAQLSDLETYNPVDPNTTANVVDDEVTSSDYPL